MPANQVPELPVRALTSEEIGAFRSDGVICVRGLYGSDWVAHLTEAIEEICAKPSPYALGDLVVTSGSKTFRSEAFNWMLNDRIRDFVLQGPTAHVVQQAFGSTKVNFFYDQIFVKRQMTMNPVPWHHDFTYWPIEGHQVASVWASVDSVDVASSALEFIAGSHAWPQRFEAMGAGGLPIGNPELEKMPDIDAARGKYKVLSWDLEPGDALLFHGLTLHSSRGNSSADRQRRAITTRWCGDDIVYRPLGNQMPIPWKHGLSSGQGLGGALFPQVLPFFDPDEIGARAEAPVWPEPDLIQQVIRQFTKRS